MLQTLHIKNLAIIDQLELNFETGFNVITGETGAGKSVLTGAIGIILGNRVDKSMIRHGCERCELSANFLLPVAPIPEVIDLLTQMEIPFEIENGQVELHFRRVITQSSTRNFVNDTSVTAQLLSQIASYIIDVHAANEHFSLHQVQTQLKLLDRYCNCEIEKNNCADLVRQLKGLRAEREQRLAECPNPTEVEHLRITVTDIENAHLSIGEEDEIIAKHTLAANSCEITEIVQRITQMTTESEGSIRDTMSEVLRQVERLAHLDSENGELFRDSTLDILAKISELSRDIERYGHRIEADEQQLQLLSDRLALIQKMKRRYGPSIEEVFETLENAKRRLLIFEDAEEMIRNFEHTERQLISDVQHACDVLRAKRKAGALKLNQAVVECLNRLGFLKAQFEIMFKEVSPTLQGADQIEMCFAANPGEGIGPLRDLASSGEMSRILLAIKAVLSEADTVPILLFDEIDVNIGGETAHIVGNELKKLARGRQIICISHLAQVAVQGDTHICVSKNVEDERTLTRAETLNKQGRLAETARMLGGGKPAEAHAKALFQQLKIAPPSQQDSLF